jgi:hypothetical protein
VDVSASTAGLAARKPAIDLHHDPAVPRRLVVQLAAEFAQARVGDAAAKTAVQAAAHWGYGQVFENQDLGVLHGRRVDLVQVIAAHIGDLRVEAPDLLLRALPALRKIQPRALGASLLWIEALRLHLCRQLPALPALVPAQLGQLHLERLGRGEHSAVAAGRGLA